MIRIKTITRHKTTKQTATINITLLRREGDLLSISPDWVVLMVELRVLGGVVVFASGIGELQTDSKGFPHMPLLPVYMYAMIK